jgi:hypothetical protein
MRTGESERIGGSPHQSKRKKSKPSPICPVYSWAWEARPDRPGPTQPENDPARRAKACCRAEPRQEFMAR